MTATNVARVSRTANGRPREWWGRCEYYFMALEMKRELIRDGFETGGLTECVEHANEWIVWAEPRAWGRRSLTHHARAR